MADKVTREAIRELRRDTEKIVKQDGKKSEKKS
jgi:hypothetical protein